MKINKLLILSALVMGGAFASCNDDPDYQAAPSEANSAVYFSTNTATTVDLKYGENSFSVPVYRANTKGEVTIDLVSKDESGLFNVAGSVTFADGKNEAFIPVTFDFNKIEPNVKYPVSISLRSSDATTAYGNSTISLLVSYAPWTAWEDAGTIDLEYAVFFSGTDPDLELQHRNSLLNPEEQQFVIKNALYGVDLVIDYNAATGVCRVPEQFTGYNHPSYGPVYVSDTYTYFEQDIEEGYQAAIENKWPGILSPSFYNAETGKFSLYLLYYVSQGFFGHGYEYGQRAGFAFYNVELSDAGHFVTPDGEDYQLVYADKSDDVASYKVDIFEGQLNDEEVKEASAQVDADGSLEVYTESSYIKYSLKEGDYTVIATGYNSGRQLVSTNVLQFHSAPAAPNTDDSADWTSLGYADYEDGWVLPAYSIDPADAPYPVEVQVNKENPNYIRLVNPYTNGESILADYNGNTKKAAIVFDCTYPQCVIVEPQFTGYTETTDIGDIYAYNYDFFLEYQYEVTPEDIIEAGLNQSTLENGVITIPTPLWTSAVVDFELGYWWNQAEQGETPIIWPTVVYLPDAPDMLRHYSAKKHYNKAMNLRLQPKYGKCVTKDVFSRPFRKRAPHVYDNKRIIGHKSF